MKKTLVLAHRGFSGLYPENSRRAFLEAASVSGCDGFESDVHLSSDGEPVIIHDATLERTTNGKGPVSAMSFKNLRELDVGSWMGPEFTGERIMHLDELLTLTLEHGLILNLELKNYEIPYTGMEEKILERIHAMEAANQVFLSSFNHISMKLCKRIDPLIRTGLLYAQPLIEAEKYAAAYDIDALHPSHNLFGFEPDLIGRCHKLGVKVNTWTVNGEEDMRTCINLGADAIITNYPDRLAAILCNC